MILLVDSGATKADWIALTPKGEQLFFTQTLGLSPEVLTRAVINERLANNFELYKHRREVSHLYFYGAGCGTKRMQDYLKAIFEDYFSVAEEIVVKEDTYAAVYAVTDMGDKGIVCILGTGSNCSYFDGEQLIQKVSSLGYILMDDCSGNYFGRQMLRDFYFHKMPKKLADEFDAAFDLDADSIKKKLYKEPNPNTYLAKFAKFLIQNKDEEYSQHLIRKGMQLFADNYIKQYKEAGRLPVHFVGSIAYYLKKELKAIMKENGFTVGTILRRPIDGLVDHHVKLMQANNAD